MANTNMADKPDIPDTPAIRTCFFAILVALSVVAYGGLLNHPLNAGGDEYYAIQDAKLILSSPTEWLSEERDMAIRPPVDLAFIIGYIFWQDDALGYHLFQIGLHLLAAWTVFRVLKQLQIPMVLSMLSTLFFLVNVSHYRTVQWVICINYILATIFALLTFLWYNRFLQANQKMALAGALFWLACAVFSHPSAFAIVLFCGYWSWRKKTAIPPVLILASSAALLIGLAYVVSPGHAQAQGAINIVDVRRLFTNPIWYLGRLLTTAHWLPASGVINEIQTADGLLGALLLTMAMILCIKRIFPAADWAMWTVIMILPFINNAQDRQIVGPSRQLYMASIGISYLFAWALYALTNKINPENRRWPALIGGALALIAVSVFALRKAEAIDYWLVGRSQVAAHQYATGLKQLQKSLAGGDQILPADFFVQYAIIALSQGEDLEKPLETAMTRFPEDMRIAGLIGVSNLSRENPNPIRRGRAQIASAIRTAENPGVIKHDIAVGLMNSGSFFHREKEFGKAIELYRSALQIRPEYPMAYANIASAHHAQGSQKQAVRALAQAAQLDPEFPQIWQKLGNLHFDTQNYTEAISAYRTGLLHDSTHAEVHYNLALTLERIGHLEDVLPHLQRSAHLMPNHTDVWVDLGEMLYETNQLADAIDIYQLLMKHHPERRDLQQRLMKMQAIWEQRHRPSNHPLNGKK